LAMAWWSSFASATQPSRLLSGQGRAPGLGLLLERRKAVSFLATGIALDVGITSLLEIYPAGVVEHPSLEAAMEQPRTTGAVRAERASSVRSKRASENRWHLRSDGGTFATATAMASMTPSGMRPVFWRISWIRQETAMDGVEVVAAAEVEAGVAAVAGGAVVLAVARDVGAAADGDTDTKGNVEGGVQLGAVLVLSLAVRPAPVVQV